MTAGGMGAAFVASPTHIFWQLTAGTSGALQLCDGSGTGGISGIGDYVLLNGAGGVGSQGELQLVNGIFTLKFGQPASNIAFSINSSSSTHTMDFGEDFCAALKAGGQTIWTFAQSSGAGLLRLCDGSGSGGLDGIGSQVLLNTVSGVVNVNANFRVQGTQVVTSKQIGPRKYLTQPTSLFDFNNLLRRPANAWLNHA